MSADTHPDEPVRGEMNMDLNDILLRHGFRHDRLSDTSGRSDVFERQFGAELAGWELTLHRGFCERVGGQRYHYRGFVHHTNVASMVMLTPSPWLIEGVFVVLADLKQVPSDGSFADVTGRTIAAPSPEYHSRSAVRAVLADSIETEPIDLLNMVTPPMNLKELSDMLFEHVGMAEASKRVFARLFASSPAYQGAVGGLTTGIQAVTSEAQVKRFLGFIHRILPPALRGKYAAHRTVKGIDVTMPKLWRIEIGKTSEPRMKCICIDRSDPLDFRELSLGALTDAGTAALPDVPLAIASEDFWVESSDPSQLMLPITKSAITYQLLTPSVSQRSVESSTKHVLSRLEFIRDSFGLEDSALARGHVLDADVLGRPLSVVRIARSTARTEWNDSVTSADLKQSWDQVLEPALKEFIELAELKTATETRWGRESKVDRFNTKVLRALKKLDLGTTGSLGPTLEEIAGEAGVEKHIAAESLMTMKDEGVIYEPRTGHYRLV